MDLVNRVTESSEGPFRLEASTFDDYRDGFADGTRVELYDPLAARDDQTLAGYTLWNDGMPRPFDFKVATLRNPTLWNPSDFAEYLDTQLRLFGRERTGLTFHAGFYDGTLLHSRRTTEAAVLAAFDALAQLYQSVPLGQPLRTQDDPDFWAQSDGIVIARPDSKAFEMHALRLPAPIGKTIDLAFPSPASPSHAPARPANTSYTLLA